MGEKCCVCGYDKCISALEFHHLNPEEKEFSISTNSNISFEKANKELKKCILVCSNCHREIHENLISVENLFSYNENKANEIFQEIEDLKTHKVFYCKTCGKIISTNSEYCPSCAALQRRKVERPSRDELKNLIRNYPFTTIANNFLVSDNAVRKWCDNYNLPRQKTVIKSYTDEEWEEI